MLRRDERAALEGLPLYLLILVVVAGLGIAVLVGIVNRVDTCKSIDGFTTNPASPTSTGTGGIGITITPSAACKLGTWIADFSGPGVGGAATATSASQAFCLQTVNFGNENVVRVNVEISSGNLAPYQGVIPIVRSTTTSPCASEATPIS